MKKQQVKTRKMKKFISKNAMALAALAIAMGSYGLMSFKSLSNNQEFGMQVNNPGEPEESITWVPLEGLTEGPDFNCTVSASTCKGYFEQHQIDPATNRPYDDEEPVSSTPGTFELP